MRYSNGSAALAWGCLFATTTTITTTDAFLNQRQPLLARPLPAAPLSVAISPPREGESPPLAEVPYLSKEETNPLIRIGKDEKEKIINAFGLWCAAVSLITGPVWMAAMSIVETINDKNEAWDPHRALFDTTGKLWAKAWLTMTMSYPTVSGEVDWLKQRSTLTTTDSTASTTGTTPVGPCLYVANHASWLDIPVLCTVLDPVFKFIAKGELRKVPCVGQQLAGGHHILIDRDDRKSQLRTFKDGIAWLQKGVPIMAFPEGMRSHDGRLMTFKKGLFALAVKAHVPIVPITISNTHAVMPAFSLFPVQSGMGKIHVHVGRPILPDGQTEAELEDLVRREFLAHLPHSQLPLTPVMEVKDEAAAPTLPHFATMR